MRVRSSLAHFLLEWPASALPRSPEWARLPARMKMPVPMVPTIVRDTPAHKPKPAEPQPYSRGPGDWFWFRFCLGVEMAGLTG